MLAAKETMLELHHFVEKTMLMLAASFQQGNKQCSLPEPWLMISVDPFNLDGMSNEGQYEPCCCLSF